jgi:hypothetical protein
MADAQGLESQRDRLIERFALMQSELGGLFYEMAIRDHVVMDVLVAKAAALQAVDAELAQVEQVLARSGSSDLTPGAPGDAPSDVATRTGIGEPPLTGGAPAPGQATVAPSQ